MNYPGGKKLVLRRDRTASSVATPADGRFANPIQTHVGASNAGREKKGVASGTPIPRVNQSGNAGH